MKYITTDSGHTVKSDDNVEVGDRVILASGVMKYSDTIVINIQTVEVKHTDRFVILAKIPKEVILGSKLSMRRLLEIELEM